MCPPPHPHLEKCGCVLLVVQGLLLQLEGGDGGVYQQSHLELLAQL